MQAKFIYVDFTTTQLSLKNSQVTIFVKFRNKRSFGIKMQIAVQLLIGYHEMRLVVGKMPKTIWGCGANYRIPVQPQ